MRHHTRLAWASLALLSFVAASASAEPTAQETALASRLYDDASKAMTAGQLSVACAKYAESQRLDPQLGTLLHLGECYSKSNKTASAWTTFKEAAELAEQRNDPRGARIRERITAIEASLSNLIIVVPEPVPAGLEVRQNGALVGRAGWGTAIPVDPGPHEITATAPGVKPRKAQANVGNEAKTVTVTLPAAEYLPVAPARSSQAVASGTGDAQARSWFASHQRVVALVVGGVGVAGIGVGSAFGLMVKPTYDKSDAHCNGDHCDDAGHDFRQSAFGKAEVSTIAFGAGAAALVGGAVLWLTAPRAERATAHTTVTPLVAPSVALLTVQRTW